MLPAITTAMTTTATSTTTASFATTHLGVWGKIWLWNPHVSSSGGILVCLPRSQNRKKICIAYFMTWGPLLARAQEKITLFALLWAPLPAASTAEQRSGCHVYLSIFMTCPDLENDVVVIVHFLRPKYNQYRILFVSFFTTHHECFKIFQRAICRNLSFPSGQGSLFTVSCDKQLITYSNISNWKFVSAKLTNRISADLLQDVRASSFQTMILKHFVLDWHSFHYIESQLTKVSGW